MNLDDRIKRELESEATEIDQAMSESNGLLELALSPFKGGLRRWMFVIYFVIAIVTVVMLWSGYQFFIAESVDARIFWGVWFVITLNAQAMMKLWTWMEINRNSVIREIKRLEIAIARLQLNHKN